MDEREYILGTSGDKMLANLKALRDQHILLDFDIHVGDETFKVHKVILAACSDYFKGMLSNETIESKSNQVILRDTSATAVRSIIDFFYTSKLKLNVDNVQETLLAARLFQVKDIENNCVEFIADRISVSNCVGVLALADRCSIPQLFERAFYLCLDRFETIVENEEFSQLDVELIIKLISYDELNVSTEDQVVLAIFKWISIHQDARIQHLEDLMRCVRFDSLSPTGLVSFEKHNLFQRSELCRKLLSEAKNYLLLRAYPSINNSSSVILEESSSNFRPRKPIHKRQCIYAVGGWNDAGKPNSSVEKYDPHSDKWERVSPMKIARCGPGVAFHKNFLYVIGGHDGQGYLKSVERYDISNDNWRHDVRDMLSERTSVGVVEHDGYIYAIGGQGLNSATNTCERYDPSNNTWVPIPGMKTKRLGAGVTVLGGLIYVVGGSDSSIQGNVLSTVECLNPKTLQWSETTPMLEARKHHGCISYNGKIYAIGGLGNRGIGLSSCECLDIVSRKWASITPMTTSRHGIGLAQLNGLIYAVGGRNNITNRTRVVEAYDPESGVWSEKASTLDERFAGSLAVIPTPERRLLLNTNSHE